MPRGATSATASAGGSSRQMASAAAANAAQPRAQVSGGSGTPRSARSNAVAHRSAGKAAPAARAATAGPAVSTIAHPLDQLLLVAVARVEDVVVLTDACRPTVLAGAVPGSTERLLLQAAVNEQHRCDREDALIADATSDTALEGLPALRRDKLIVGPDGKPSTINTHLLSSPYTSSLPSPYEWSKKPGATPRQRTHSASSAASASASGGVQAKAKFLDERAWQDLLLSLPAPDLRLPQPRHAELLDSLRLLRQQLMLARTAVDAATYIRKHVRTTRTQYQESMRGLQERLLTGKHPALPAPDDEGGARSHAPELTTMMLVQSPRAAVVADSASSSSATHSTPRRRRKKRVSSNTSAVVVETLAPQPARRTQEPQSPVGLAVAVQLVDKTSQPRAATTGGASADAAPAEGHDCAKQVDDHAGASTSVRHDTGIDVASETASEVFKQPVRCQNHAISADESALGMSPANQVTETVAVTSSGCGSDTAADTPAVGAVVGTSAAAIVDTGTATSDRTSVDNDAEDSQAATVSEDSAEGSAAQSTQQPTPVAMQFSATTAEDTHAAAPPAMDDQQDNPLSKHDGSVVSPAPGLKHAAPTSDLQPADAAAATADDDNEAAENTLADQGLAEDEPEVVETAQSEKTDAETDTVDAVTAEADTDMAAANAVEAVTVDAVAEIDKVDAKVVQAEVDADKAVIPTADADAAKAIAAAADTDQKAADTDKEAADTDNVAADTDKVAADTDKVTADTDKAAADTDKAAAESDKAETAADTDKVDSVTEADTDKADADMAEAVTDTDKTDASKPDVNKADAEVLEAATECADIVDASKEDTKSEAVATPEADTAQADAVPTDPSTAESVAAEECAESKGAETAAGSVPVPVPDKSEPERELAAIVRAPEIVDAGDADSSKHVGDQSAVQDADDPPSKARSTSVASLRSAAQQQVAVSSPSPTARKMAVRTETNELVQQLAGLYQSRKGPQDSHVEETDGDDDQAESKEMRAARRAYARKLALSIDAAAAVVRPSKRQAARDLKVELQLQLDSSDTEGEAGPAKAEKSKTMRRRRRAYAEALAARISGLMDDDSSGDEADARVASRASLRVADSPTHSHGSAPMYRAVSPSSGQARLELRRSPSAMSDRSISPPPALPESGPSAGMERSGSSTSVRSRSSSGSLGGRLMRTSSSRVARLVKSASGFSFRSNRSQRSGSTAADTAGASNDVTSSLPTPHPPATLRTASPARSPPPSKPVEAPLSDTNEQRASDAHKGDPAAAAAPVVARRPSAPPAPTMLGQYRRQRRTQHPQSPRGPYVSSLSYGESPSSLNHADPAPGQPPRSPTAAWRDQTPPSAEVPAPSRPAISRTSSSVSLLPGSSGSGNCGSNARRGRVSPDARGGRESPSRRRGVGAGKRRSRGSASSGGSGRGRTARPGSGASPRHVHARSRRSLALTSDASGSSSTATLLTAADIAAAEAADVDPAMVMQVRQIQKLARSAMLWRRASRVRPLRRKYSAIMIQQWWRQTHARDVWKAVWKANYSRESAEWCKHRHAIINAYKTQLSELQGYRAHDEIYRIRSAVRIQSAVRAFQARQLLQARRRWVLIVQSVARRWLAQREAAWQQRFMDHQHNRQRRYRWQVMRQRAWATYSIDSGQVVTWLAASKEIALVTGEMQAELQRFELAWNRWNDLMTRAILDKRCGPEWVPQMDVTSATTYFLNIHTGRIQYDSPNMLFVMANRKRERPKAEAFFTERMNYLIVYREHVRRAEFKQRALFNERQRARILTLQHRGS